MFISNPTDRYLSQRRNIKLFPQFYSPFEVIEKVGSVAYQLDLLEAAQIHFKFHVSLLKKKLGRSNHSAPQLPPINVIRVLKQELEAVLD